jgi:hypothetical protein
MIASEYKRYSKEQFINWYFTVYVNNLVQGTDRQPNGVGGSTCRIK